MATGAFGINSQFRNQLLQTEGLASEMGTGTASSGAVTVNDYICRITSEDLTTAQNAIYTLTVTNSKIAANDLVKVVVGNGTNSAGSPMLGTVTPAAGSVVITVHNKHASAVAFNGNLKIMFQVIKAL